MSARSLRNVPNAAMVLLGVAFVAQLGWHALRPGPSARAEDLPNPPAPTVLRIAAFGDPPVLAQGLMLWLQAFDDPPGVSIPFARLDYTRVEGWLDRILALDPRGHYPLLAASRLYGSVAVPAKRRSMFEFVYRQFLKDPNRRWRWLAHAAIVAKHQLHDLPLALRYARALSRYATGSTVPFWARDMTYIILDNMGEIESARVFLGGLIASGQISDPHELRFLKQRLRELEARRR